MSRATKTRVVHSRTRLGVDFGRLGALPGVLSGVSGHPSGPSGRSWGVPGMPRDARKTLPRCLWNTLERHGVSRDRFFIRFWVPRDLSRGRSSLDFHVHFRVTFASELASE